MTLRIIMKKESTEGFEKVEENERMKQELLHEFEMNREKDLVGTAPGGEEGK